MITKKDEQILMFTQTYPTAIRHIFCLVRDYTTYMMKKPHYQKLRKVKAEAGSISFATRSTMRLSDLTGGDTIPAIMKSQNEPPISTSRNSERVAMSKTFELRYCVRHVLNGRPKDLILSVKGSQCHERHITGLRRLCRLNKQHVTGVVPAAKKPTHKGVLYHGNRFSYGIRACMQEGLNVISRQIKLLLLLPTNEHFCLIYQRQTAQTTVSNSPQQFN